MTTFLDTLVSCVMASSSPVALFLVCLTDASFSPRAKVVPAIVLFGGLSPAWYFLVTARLCGFNSNTLASEPRISLSACSLL